ncbi:MAG: CinA family protein, partial [Clostridiales Family XIII bacterium]|nr:CinA family protein [Clostridiales Family XIII bacterium]
ISGASTIFTFSAVTYSNDAKEKILNVKNMTLKKFGAVSEQTVSEMLDGLMSKKLSDIEIAVSGIAGPLSDDTAKEVGLVYIGVAGKKGKKIKEFRFGNIGRDKIRHNTVLAMLRMLLAHNL